MIWLLIAIGGAFGATARHLLASLLAARVGDTTAFPTGTFVVNLVGCFAAGVLLGVVGRPSLSNELRAFLMVGVLGGFTTFSAFSAETVMLLQAGHSGTALTYVTASIASTLVAVWAGTAIVNTL